LFSNNDLDFKRYLRSKAWRDRQREIVYALPEYRSSRKSSSTFIQYLHDFKKGKFKSEYDIISISKEVGVISSISALLQSNLPFSIILNPFAYLPFHDNFDTMDISVKSIVCFCSTDEKCIAMNLSFILIRSTVKLREYQEQMASQ